MHSLTLIADMAAQCFTGRDPETDVITTARAVFDG